MTVPPGTLADAALCLVGTRFRLHGRDPATGLDCVGLVAASLAMIGAKPVPPSGYAMRNLSIDRWLEFAQRSGLEAAEGALAPGDVLLVRLGYGQHHLMIAVGAGAAVHAHAGLGRVVRQPLDPALALTAHWRIAADSRRG